MKKLYALVALLCATPLFSQQLGPTAIACQQGACVGNGPPVGACNSTSPAYTDFSIPQVYTCQRNAWVKVSGGGSGGGATIPVTTSLLKGDGAGNGAAATAGIDYQNAAGTYTFATLPTASAANLGFTYALTDGVAGSGCSTGGGTLVRMCQVYSPNSGTYAYRATNIPPTEKNIANGVAGLDSTGKALPANLPVVSTAQAGILPQLPGGTTGFLRADGTFVAPPTGGGTTLPANLTGVQTDGSGNATQQTSPNAVAVLNNSPSTTLSSALIPTLNQNTTGTASTITGTVAATKVTGLATSATTDTTNAANITSGVLATAQVPSLPPTKITGLAASATTDTTNASNIVSGTLPVAQVPTITSAKVSDFATAAAAQVNNANVVSAIGAAPAIGGQHIAGANVVYDFLPTHISGTTIYDQSGSGNNGTATAAVVSGLTGVTMTAKTASIALPAAVNANRTFCYAYTLPSVYTNSGTLYVGAFLASATSSTGFSLRTASLYTGGNPPQGNTPNVLMDGPGYALNTVSTSPLTAGYHNLCAVRGTGSGDLDHIYLDGVETYAYDTQGFSAAAASGNFVIGGGGGLGWPSIVNWQFYEFRSYAAALTAAQVASEATALNSDAGTRGVNTNNAGNSFTRGMNLLCEGDSIMAGYNDGNPYCPNFTMTGPGAPTYANRVNFATIGIYAATNYFIDYQRVMPYITNAQGGSDVIIADGTNDLSGTASAVQIVNTIRAQVQSMAKAGGRVVVATLTDRGDIANAGNGGTIRANLDAINNSIRAGYEAWGAVAVLDLAADPNLGAAGASSNTSYFNSDKLHPNGGGGTLMTALTSRVFSYLYGYSAAIPNYLAASTATYAMLTSDKYLVLAPAQATTITAPNCIGLVNGQFTIENFQSAYAVTLKGFASTQTINGTDYSTTGFTIPSNSSVRLRTVFNGASTGGCHLVLN